MVVFRLKVSMSESYLEHSKTHDPPSERISKRKRELGKHLLHGVSESDLSAREGVFCSRKGGMRELSF